MRKFFSNHHQLRIIFSGIIGTTMMTLYSYLVSVVKEKEFKEPTLLGKLICRLVPWREKKDSYRAGWAMHYLVGVLFAEMYAPYWYEQPERSNVKKGLILGGISGIAAILIWKFTLDVHPLPPAVDFLRFAGQLFMAHLVFGLFAAIGYDLPKAII